MNSPDDDQVRVKAGTHDQWDELAVGYALTALEPDEMERFIEHLVAFCPQCQRSVDETATVGAELGQAVPSEIAPPSAGLRDSVLRAALAARPAVPQTSADLPRVRDISPATVPSVIPSTSSDPAITAPRTGSGAHRVIDLAERRSRRSGRSTSWLVAAAAAVVALVLSVTTVAALHSKSRTSAEASQYHQAIVSALTTPGQVVPLKDESGANIASVVAHSHSVNVVSLSMAPNAKTSTYVLWGISGKTRGPTALGVFDIAGRRVQSAQVATDSRGYKSFTSYAVSREPGRTPPAAPTTIVATG